MKAISYAEYMDLALYHPEKGYYMKEKKKIGKSGDFYTTSNIHPVFAKLFARFVHELVTAAKIEPYFCEFGAGEGRFAHGFLQELKRHYPETFMKLTYLIVEMSPYHRQQQSKLLHTFPEGKILTYSSLSTLMEQFPAFQGIVFSNELFDAFPVHVITKRGGTLFEIMVGINDNGELMETCVPCENNEIAEWLKRYFPPVQPEQRVEVPLAMTNFLERLATWIDKGLVITIDYGYTNEEWLLPERKDGSLRGYKDHQMITKPLLYPGEMDLTTHIPLTAFETIGQQHDLQLLARMKQQQFVLQLGILDYLQEHYDPNPFSDVSKQNRAIRSLLMDGGISSAFEVIVQQKGYPDLQLFHEKGWM